MTRLAQSPTPEEVEAIKAEQAARAARQRTSWTATDLLAFQFPPVRWAVPGLIAEGLTLLASPPKAGKSWMVLGLCAAVASGGRALGSVEVEEGESLALALEDNPRRLQNRLEVVLAGEPAPEGLHIETAWPRAHEGGTDLLLEWLAAHPDCRLVVIDTFARFRAPVKESAGAYASDYAAVAPLADVAAETGTGLVVVHHTRKMPSADFLETVSGTQAIAGAADSVAVLKKTRGSAEAELQMTGRDLEEAEHALTFDADAGGWRLLEGDAERHRLSPTRRAILDFLDEQDGAVTAKAAAEALDLKYETVKKTLQRMYDDGQVIGDGAGEYRARRDTP